MLELKVIDGKNYIYIANKDSWESNLNEYLFDNKKPEKTNKRNWYRLSKIPTTVSQKQQDKRINERYELKKGYKPTELMPQIITKEMYKTDEFEEVIGLYTYKYDTVPGGYENVDFNIDTIYSREDFEFVPNEYGASTDLLTQIEYPEEAYQDRPCRLDSEQMLKMIRNYVKANIDTTVAQITSDYDFHFEVVKRIQLADPYNILVDQNNSWLNKRRKPKWINKMISEKKATIINFKDKNSSSDYGKDCVVAPTITGENYKDLQNKVEKYLEELMKQINKKYCECPNCKGWGIVEEE